MSNYTFPMVVGDYHIKVCVTGPWKENCYLLTHRPSCEQVLIDPGDDPGKIIEMVASEKGTLKYILATHAHVDHIAAVTSVCEEFDQPCWVHIDDKRLFRHAPNYSVGFIGKTIAPPKHAKIYELPADFTLGDQNIEVIHLPGHTGGSVGFNLGEFIFTGDTLLYENLGRTDLPGADKKQLKNSIERLLSISGESSLLFSGHGRPWTLKEARSWWRMIKESNSLPQYRQINPD